MRLLCSIVRVCTSRQASPGLIRQEMLTESGPTVPASSCAPIIGPACFPS